MPPLQPHAVVRICVALMVASAARGQTTPNGGTPMEQFLVRVGLVQPGGTKPAPRAVELTAARQDWKHLTADLSCHTLTPLRIGDRPYRKGLGAHANGAAAFQLNEPFVRFEAEVGIDNNPDTAGTRGSAVFVVKVDGHEVARTPVCRGGEPPRRVDAPLKDARVLELIVTDAGDGISFDQSDWAEARLTDAAGHTTYLSDVLHNGRPSPFLTQQGLPTSFVYGGETSHTLLALWPRADAPVVEQAGRTVHETTWSEPGGGLAATLRTVLLPGGAAELRWSFRNTGGKPTRTLSEVRALDLGADIAPGQARLLHSTGGLTGGLASDDLGFALAETPLGRATLSAAGGRSSNRDLPFFSVHADDDVGGIFVGVGWSGQWQADIGQEGSALRTSVQVPGLHFGLAPGEQVVMPSVLLGAYQGSARAGTNALRKVLYDSYVPLLGGTKPLPPVSWNSWFVLTNTITEALLKREADVAADLGIEYFCIDAGWFEGDFPDGVGNWTLNRTKFPAGLGGIGEYARSKGMKLGLWFEPERAAAGTRLTREHPEWIHGDLLDLGNPAAREWVFQMMCGYIDEGGIRWIRFDFNTEPLGTWDRMDTPDTRGLAQIRHVMGLYELLDRLIARYPDLLIEGCASGGRRIDLETIRRSHTFWKSDETGSLPVIRFHEAGGNQFLPAGLLNTNLLSVGGEGDVLGLFAGPLGFGADLTRLSAKQRTLVKESIAAYKQVRHLLNRDYYPLFPQQRDASGWLGWQFDDAETGEGLILVLRPEGSSYAAADLRVQGVDPRCTYLLEPVAQRAGRPETVAGDRLARGWRVTLPQPGQARAFRYRRQAARPQGASPQGR